MTVEQAEGRRIRQVVRSDEGSIIAAPGQIVTAQVIERAKTYHQEQALLEAVGLSIGKAVRDSTSSATIVAGDRLKSTTQNTGEQLQAGAKSLWAQVKDTASGLQDRGSQAIEEKQIKGALGRPVTRVILDRHDDVILNVGELITHEAIASSRQSQVLDLLLSSVYSEKPRLSLENLRAPKPGRAAVYRRYPLTILLKKSGSSVIIEPIQLKLDPGSQTTGIALVQGEKVIFGAELTHRGQAIKAALESRKAIQGLRTFKYFW